MRDVNVVKYRKLLRELQSFCGLCRLNLWRESLTPKNYRRCFTDYERGYIAGQYKAYNEVLRKVESMMVDAEYDWHSVHCREENVKS